MASPEYHGEPASAQAAKRKLTAILSADVTGFSRLMGADEMGTHTTLTAHRQVMDSLIARHEGRIVGTAGDGVLADFPSVVEALGAAVEIQKALRKRNAAYPAERRLEFRIGINLGDVIVDGDDIFGDGVNVAARIEALAEPGGIAISGAVYDQVSNKLDLNYRDRGNYTVKNITAPVRVYGVDLESAGALAPGAQKRPARWVWASVGLVALIASGGLILWLAWPAWLARETAPEQAVGRQAVEQPVATMQPDAKPTIAVMPFENQSDDAEQDYFSDGVTQDIIGALGRFSNLLVMSWEAVLPYAAEAAALDRLSRELAVRYVVRGSVRRDQNRVRVAVQLTDASRGVLLWSERYDQEIDDIFAVQDEITQAVVGALAVELSAVEQQRALIKATDNLDAYDYVLRGRQHLQQQTRSTNLEAREMFDKAVELDPEYAAAYVGLGWTYDYDAAYGWTARPDRALQTAYELAQQAIRLNPSNASAHTLLSNVHVYRQRYDLGLAEIDRAIELNPSEAESHAYRGWVMLASGRSDDAIKSIETALRFNPNSPPNVFANLGWAYYLEGRHDDAIATLEGVLTHYPDHAFAVIALAAAYAESNRPEDAARAAAMVRRVSPFFEAESFVQLFQDQANREQITAALSKAGLD